MYIKESIITAFSAVALWSGSTVLAATITTFEDGQNHGWTVNGQQPISMTGGNPGACLPVSISGTFGVAISNDADPDVIGDYTAKGQQVRLSVDIDTDSITVPPTSTPRTRRLIAELVHYNGPEDFYEYYSAYVDIGQLESIGIYQTYAVTFDTTTTALPAGWGGYGDEDDNGVFMFPRDKTFTDLLTSVDEIRFSTYVPGQNYLPTNFAFRVDNVSVTAVVPEPTFAAAGLFSIAMLMLARNRTRRHGI